VIGLSRLGIPLPVSAGDPTNPTVIMKVLLIYPYCLEDRVHPEDAEVVPIGLYYIGALLRSGGHNVRIVNAARWRDTPEKIDSLLDEMRPGIVGCSVLNANRWGALDVCRRVRASLPEARTVLGGVGATFLWRHLLTHFEQVDYIVLGEGEKSFADLVRWLMQAPSGMPERIRGVAYRGADGPCRTAPADPVGRLDDLPNPARWFTFQHVALTRGCVADCRFCGSPRYWGRRLRSHSSAYFVEMLAQLAARGVTFFYVSDDTFTANRRRVIAICRLILERRLQLTWAAISRVDMVDEELLAWMRRAGCVQISYGVESGSETIREHLNKGFSNRRVLDAFRWTARCGILPRAYFIYGCPGESWETIAASMRLIERIRPLGAIFYILTLYPGTALMDAYARQNRLTDDIWLEKREDILYFETDPAISREQVLEWGRFLRDGFHQRLPRFVQTLELNDGPEWRALNADFCSRLALTFQSGDYARVDQIPAKKALAEALYRRALAFAPDQRAYLGLGMLAQHQRRFAESARILSQGVAQHPDQPQLAICLAVSLMNIGRFDAAIDLLAPLAHLPEAESYLAACYRETGEAAKAAGSADHPGSQRKRPR
jgi:anaerobic magnesium-protoporphyrin IX monomethyl ester cyclase